MDLFAPIESSMALICGAAACMDILYLYRDFQRTDDSPKLVSGEEYVLCAREYIIVFKPMGSMHVGDPCCFFVFQQGK